MRWFNRLGTSRQRVLLGGVAVACLAVAVVAGLVLLTATPPPAPSPSGTASPVARLTAAPTPRPTVRPTPRPAPTADPTPTPSLPAFADDGRLTVLVLGSDSSAARRALGRNSRTDAIMVISVREDGRGLVLFSLPRDTTDVELPDGTLWTAKINALAPTLGPRIAADTVGRLLGITVDHYVQIDMDDLMRLVDAVGGVTVDVSHTLSDSACTIPPGRHHLDSSLALCFARHRQTDDDYARAGRHQLLLLGLRDRFISGEVDVAAAIASLARLQTDIDLENLTRLLEIARLSESGDATRVVLGPPAYTEFVGIAGARGWISTPNVPAIRTVVRELLAE